MTAAEIDNRQHAFGDLLLSVIEETMRQIFKEEGAKVIHDFLKKQSGLQLNDAAEKPEAFSAALESLLGSGAKTIEFLVLKKLYRQLGLKFEEKKAYGFPDYIKELNKMQSLKHKLKEGKESTLTVKLSI